MISRCSEVPHLRQIAACRISKAPRTPRLDPCQGLRLLEAGGRDPASSMRQRCPIGIGSFGADRAAQRPRPSRRVHHGGARSTIARIIGSVVHFGRREHLPAIGKPQHDAIGVRSKKCITKPFTRGKSGSKARSRPGIGCVPPMRLTSLLSGRPPQTRGGNND